jgi:hypothetical protein
MEMCDKLHAPAALPPWKELTYTKKIRNWMTLNASVNAEEKKSFRPTKIKIKKEEISL